MKKGSRDIKNKQTNKIDFKKVCLHGRAQTTKNDATQWQATVGAVRKQVEQAGNKQHSSMASAPTCRSLLWVPTTQDLWLMDCDMEE